MFKQLLSRFTPQRKRPAFPGGLTLPAHKITSDQPIRALPLPDQLIVPLSHYGATGLPCVSVGERVLRGQPLTRGDQYRLPAHAPTSGTVAALAPAYVADAPAQTALCAVLIPDGDDRPYPFTARADYHRYPAQQLIEHITQCGISGLGGAGFPTGRKLAAACRSGIDTLIINGAECEPCLTADDRLMQEHAGAISAGIRILMHILQPRRVLFAIEDDKPVAIAALRPVLADLPNTTLRIFPARYPSGSARQLIQLLCGKTLPRSEHTLNHGILVQNVATVYAIQRAVTDGEPLTERIVTVTGRVPRPGNFRVRIGTPVSALLHHVGCETLPDRLILGGPLTGKPITAHPVPITKTSACVLVPDPQIWPADLPEQPCIRCGRCSEVCPASLLPQQLYWHCRGGETAQAEKLQLNECIECAACQWVCPSHIPLVRYFQQTKQQLSEQQATQQRRQQARQRFTAKQQRQANPVPQRAVVTATRPTDATPAPLLSAPPAGDQALSIKTVRRPLPEHAARTAVSATHSPTEPASSARQAAVNAALERVRAKRLAQQASGDTATSSEAEPASSTDRDAHRAAVNAALARVREKRLAQQTSGDTAAASAAQATPSTDRDAHKAAVNAALARVRAKRFAQQASTDTAIAPTAEAALSPDRNAHKAAVNAALARVRAKRFAQQASGDTAVASAAEAAPSPDRDAHKAAVNAALERVRAKRLAQQASADTAASPAAEAAPSPDRNAHKAAVNAALERVRAKRLAQQASEDTAASPAAEPAPSTDRDARKAAVNAALARVRAKRQRRLTTVADATAGDVSLPFSGTGQRPSGTAPQDVDRDDPPTGKEQS